MDYKHNKEFVPLAKTLRKNMTKEEKHLWYDYLREYPVRFIRQKVTLKYRNRHPKKIQKDGVHFYIDKIRKGDGDMQKKTLEENVR